MLPVPLAFHDDFFECGSARHQVSNVRRKQRSHRSGGAGFTLHFKVSSSEYYGHIVLLRLRFEQQLEQRLSKCTKRKGDEVADSDDDDNISLNVRQSFGPPSPIQRSGKKGVAVELMTMPCTVLLAVASFLSI